MTTKKNRTITQGTDQQVIDGIKKDLQTMSSLSLGGTTYTPTTLEALIQSRIDAANGVISMLARNQIVAQQLRVDQANLEDAFLELTGKHAEEA